MIRNKIKRRKFLQYAAAGSYGFGLQGIPALIPSNSQSMVQEIMPGKIALQLWTVREQIEKDAQGTLNKVADMGYGAVETAFFPDEISIDKGAKMITSAGLEVCSIHVEIPKKENTGQIIEMADAYNCKTLVWHGWPEEKRYKTEDGTKELATIYNEAGEWAKAHELEFGIHNHWWEFEKQPSGRLAIEVLKNHLHDDIFFEIDTYWVTVAGQDPAAIVGKFGHRAPLLHIKDGPAQWTSSLDNDEPEAMVAVGTGNLDFPAIVEAANGNTKWMIVELDNCATNMMEAVSASFKYLVGKGLARNN